MAFKKMLGAFAVVTSLLYGQTAFAAPVFLACAYDSSVGAAGDVTFTVDAEAKTVTAPGWSISSVNVSDTKITFVYKLAMDGNTLVHREATLDRVSGTLRVRPCLDVSGACAGYEVDRHCKPSQKMF